MARCFDDPWLRAAPLLALTACGRVGYDVEPAGDAPGASDAGTLVDLAINGGCEDGHTNWEAWNGDPYASPVARSGAGSCGSCMRAGFTFCTIDDYPIDTVQAPRPGERYRASAWLRAEPGGTADRTGTIMLREWIGLEVQGARTAGTLVTLSTDEWREVVVEHTIEGADDLAMDVFPIQNGAPGDCFLADDITVVRLR